MIVLRKFRTQQGNYHNVILSDDLTGIADGVNKIFTTTYEYEPSRIQILFNGQVLTSPADFEETGVNEITFLYITPITSDVLKANYELSDVSNIGTFLDLTDTPTSYEGHAGEFVKVNSSEDGLEFVPAVDGAQEGIAPVASGVSSTAIAFDTPFADNTYVLFTELQNTVDPCPSIYPTIVTAKTTSGFAIQFAGEIDSANYSLNWLATTSGSIVGGGSGSVISGTTNNYYTLDLVEDTTPELGGDLQVGNNVIMLDTTPSGNYVHGYTIGWSGEASEMYVQRNDTGFGCPLYMRSDGKWFQCTAASGTTQMPCAALALDEGTGIKKILWKGIVRRTSWSWTPGNIIYVSTVAGALTNVAANSGAWVQPVGLAIKPDTIRFDPGFYPGYLNI